MQFQIKNRWTGNVQFSCELSAEIADKSYGLQLGFAVKAARNSGAVLRGADLSGADLSDADLSDADLRDADLSGADLSGADLSGADLSGADLSGAVLSGADLSGADLSGADLSGADLSGADLSGADLRGAVLRDADLRGADLRGADLRSFKADLWMTLTQNPHEVPALIDALRAGRVDGSVYEGECACLVGTIANARGINYEDLDHNASNPAERWFAMIHSGDKPGDDSAGGFAAKLALEWSLEWCALNGMEIPSDASA